MHAHLPVASPTPLVSTSQAMQGSPSRVPQVLESSGLIPQAKLESHLSIAAYAVLGAVFEWQTFPEITSALSLFLPFSETIVADSVYAFFVVGRGPDGDVFSEHVSAQTSDQYLRVDNLTVSTTATSLTASWLPAAVDDLSKGVELTLRAAERGNALETPDATELRVVAVVRLPPNVTQYTFGEFESVLEAEHPRVFPFTIYLLAARVLRQAGMNGVRQSLVALTQAGPPTNKSRPALRLNSEPSPSFLEMAVQLPAFPNGVVRVCTVYYTAHGSNETLSVSERLTKVEQEEGMIKIDVADLPYFTAFDFVAECATDQGSVRSDTEVFSTLEIVPPTLNSPLLRYEPATALIGAARATLVWFELSPPPGAILHYEVGLFLDGKDTVPHTNFLTHETSFVLPTAELYLARFAAVRATTSAGTGRWSRLLDVEQAIELQKRSGGSQAPEEFWSPALMGGIVGVAVAAALLAALLMGLYVRKQAQQRNEVFNKIKERISPEVLAALARLNGGRNRAPRRIDVGDLHVVDLLGEGKFGRVHKAVLDESESRSMPAYLVAVKQSKEEAPRELVDELLMEAVVMAQFSHPNIVNLIGYSCEDDSAGGVGDGDGHVVAGSVLVVSQFCEYGSLISYLQERDVDEVYQLSIHFAVDVAAGMAYITESGFVHRDLAVCNISLCLCLCVYVCACLCLSLCVYVCACLCLCMCICACVYL
jgi:hypothetical protein